jgi:hypothetical protein
MTVSLFSYQLLSRTPCLSLDMYPG